MDPLQQTTEIRIQDQYQQEKKITKEQEVILFQLHLANVLLFGAGTLTPEQQKQQKDLTKQYLTTLIPGDSVEVGLQGCMPCHPGTVVSNDGKIVKIKSSCYMNKKKKEGVRSFSTTDGSSKGFILEKDDWFDEHNIKRFFIEIPESHTVKSTAGIPKEALDEINEIYKQAGDGKTCYDLVNTLKYGNPDPEGDFIL